MNHSDDILASIHRAILEEPDDDLHRLAYADRVEELALDPERAELIRIQIERHHFLASGQLMNAHQRALRERVRELLDRRKLDWWPEFHPVHSAWDTLPNLLVERGFLDTIDIDAPQFGCAAMRDLFARHPLRKIRVTGRWDTYAQVISSVIPPRLRVLEFGGGGAGEGMTRSEAYAVVSYSKHAGWQDTLEELSYELGNDGAFSILAAALPKVKLRVAGVLYSAQDERQERRAIEFPSRGVVAATNEEAVDS